MTGLAASAPHIHDAGAFADLVDWGPQPDALAPGSVSRGRLLWKGPGGRPESGLWVCTPGAWRLSVPGPEFCHFVAGRAVYEGDGGDRIEIAPGTCVLFPEGWTGRCTVEATMRCLYMLAGPPGDAAAAQAPAGARAAVMRAPRELADLVDWGPIPTMIEGRSLTSGRLLGKGPEGRPEAGLWVCTPGRWACHVTADEFCHFLAGRATYVHDEGEVIEIAPDTAAFFPAGWRGECTVHETLRKVYMIA